MSVTLISSDATTGSSANTTNSTVNGAANDHPVTALRHFRRPVSSLRPVAAARWAPAVTTATSGPGADGLGLLLHRLQRGRRVLPADAHLLHLGVEDRGDLIPGG